MIENEGSRMDKHLSEALSIEALNERFIERIEYGIVEYRRTFKPDCFLGEGERSIFQSGNSHKFGRNMAGERRDVKV